MASETSPSGHSYSIRDRERPKKIHRRSRIPNRPNCNTSLWSVMRNCVGKELSRISMPVDFNEPLSFLQRLTEDLEYAALLDHAAELTDSCEQMCYVAAYAVSCYATTGTRTTKPFNPLLGETYECDRTSDLGWWSMAEQVCHHPPTTVHHAEGKNWIMYQDFTMTSRFRGKYLSVTPSGYTHIKFKNTGNHYVYQKCTTTVHNIIVGKLWVDNHGEINIQNCLTGDKCCLKFHVYSYFAPDKARKVTGIVKDKKGDTRYLIQGRWDKEIEIAAGSRRSKTDDSFQRIWTINPPYENSENMYRFTRLAVELNEKEAGVAPTDSRNRPDQRIMEEGNFDRANIVKEELERKQRANRQRHKQDVEKSQSYSEYEPRWFDKTQDGINGITAYIFNGDYWKCKETQDWSRCPSIFL